MVGETRTAYGEALAQLVKENENVVVLAADVSGSCKTNTVVKVAPERHINAGIAECNMMGMAAGLAVSGKTVFASSFAIFAAGRPFEIIRNSICYPNLNVKVCATHAGLCVGEDGASHQAIEDISLMRSLPNMKVYVPCDYEETKAIINKVAKEYGPTYVRMGRGKVDEVYPEGHIFDFDHIDILKEGKDVVLFATGLMVQEALKAKEELEKAGISASVINVTCIKPIDGEGIKQQLRNHKMAYALEEHNIYGGLFSAISELKAVTDINTPIVPIGVNDTFGESGKAKDVLEGYGMTAENIINIVKATYKK